jgi:glycosyltransferase involved in cell wall biosynthesis
MSTADSRAAVLRPGAPSISVVIPVYNSEQMLPVVTDRVLSVIAAMTPRHELVLVNDASRDGSWQVIEGLAATRRSVRGVDLARNAGQHNALLCGLRAARGEIIVTLDDDLQQLPEEIPLLVAELERGFDVVYGARPQEQHGLMRNLASRITKIMLQSTMGARTARHLSPFRAIRQQVVSAFNHYNGPYVNIDVLLTWGTTRFSYVPITHMPRAAGASNYTARSLVRHAFNMITGFTTLPLKLASLVGFLFTLFGIAVLAFVLLRYVREGASVPGFAFLASVIAIFSGAQLFALGIMGEYLARMHLRLMDRPPYVIGRTAAASATDTEQRSS